MYYTITLSESNWFDQESVGVRRPRRAKTCKLIKGLSNETTNVIFVLIVCWFRIESWMKRAHFWFDKELFVRYAIICMIPSTLSFASIRAFPSLSRHSSATLMSFAVTKRPSVSSYWAVTSTAARRLSSRELWANYRHFSTTMKTCLEKMRIKQLKWSRNCHMVNNLLLNRSILFGLKNKICIRFLGAENIISLRLIKTLVDKLKTELDEIKVKLVE